MIWIAIWSAFFDVRPLAAPRTFSSFDTALLLLTLKLELRPPYAVARHVVEPIFFARLLARPVAPRRFGNLHTCLIAAASVRVDGHRRHQADHEGPQDKGRPNEEKRGGV
jgi:hypothetical protein